MRFRILSEEHYAQEMAQTEQRLARVETRGELRSFDGCRLSWSCYRSGSAKAAVVFVHGFTEFSEKYHELCAYFLEMGYDAFLLDLRGHGLSERQVSDPHLAHVEHFSDYVEDLECYISQIVRPSIGEMPLYLFAHSMGGSIASLWMAKYGGASRAVLSSPMVCPRTYGFPRRALRRIVRRYATEDGRNGKFRYAGEFTPSPVFEKCGDLSFARFRYNLDKRIADVRYQNSSATNAWMEEALTVQEALLDRKTMSAVRARVLLLYGGRDASVRKLPIRRLAALLPKGSCRCFRKGKHGLYTSDNALLAEYLQTVFAFFDAD